MKVTKSLDLSVLRPRTANAWPGRALAPVLLLTSCLLCGGAEPDRAAPAPAQNPVLPGQHATPTAPDTIPHSPLIQQIRWAPTNTIRRAARGSDNWPLTWADDDALYGAYGDGNGFEPFESTKLSLGFVRIDGSPQDFRGQNLRALSLRTVGDGAKGRKASGLLCAGGVIYLWTRNVNNSRLTWSPDHGATWACAAWPFTNSFGCPTFLNFGKNNAGARDEFAYIYSPDGDSAYRTADQIVLARAPVVHLSDRQAYEFFAGVDSANRPRWTLDLAERRGVLAQPGRCYRSSVTWNRVLRRYLLVQTVPSPDSRDRTGTIDTRFTGGLAVYDAPEPWGPWTTVYFTERWDVGPGDTASFPAKWISEDGLTLHLVFSGDDSFSVRQATLVLAPKGSGPTGATQSP